MGVRLSLPLENQKQDWNQSPHSRILSPRAGSLQSPVRIDSPRRPSSLGRETEGVALETAGWAGIAGFSAWPALWLTSSPD